PFRGRIVFFWPRALRESNSGGWFASDSNTCMLLSRIRSLFRDWFQPEERAILRVQLLVLLAINVLLSLGYYAQREWRRIADEQHLRLILHGWDGFAWYA